MSEHKELVLVEVLRSFSPLKNKQTKNPNNLLTGNVAMEQMFWAETTVLFQLKDPSNLSLFPVRIRKVSSEFQGDRLPNTGLPTATNLSL